MRRTDLLQYLEKASDRTAIEEAVSPKSPYQAQIHVVYGMWEEEDLIQRRCVRLEEAAVQNGWAAERFEDGLLLLRG